MPSDPTPSVPAAMSPEDVAKLIHALNYRPERSRPIWRNRHTGKEVIVVDLFVDDNGGFQGGCRRFVVQTDEALPPGPPAPPRKGRGSVPCHDLASWLRHWEPVGRWVDWPRPEDEAPTATEPELRAKLDAFGTPRPATQQDAWEPSETTDIGGYGGES